MNDDDDLHHFLITHGDSITLDQLTDELSVLRKCKALWPPETPEQLDRELTALAAKGLARRWSEVVDGKVVALVEGVYAEVVVDPQGSLFG
jgi:hypothetical protein